MLRCVTTILIFTRHSGAPDMYFAVLRAAAVLMALGAGLALAADVDTCRKAIGDDSIAACGRLVAKNPKDADAFTNLGVAYERKGDHDRAIANFDRAIAANPKYALAFLGRGV